MIKIATTIASLSFAGFAVAGVSPAPVVPAPAPVVQETALSYNNLEVDWLHTEFDDVANLDSGDGVGARWLYSMTEGFYLSLGGGWQSIDINNGGSADIWSASVGVGAYYPLTSNIHLVGEVGALFYGYDNAPMGYDDNDASAYARPYVRAQWGALELQAGATWSNIDVTNEWSAFARLYFAVAQNWDLAAGVSAGENETTVNAGLRLRF